MGTLAEDGTGYSLAVCMNTHRYRSDGTSYSDSYFEYFCDDMVMLPGEGWASLRRPAEAPPNQKYEGDYFDMASCATESDYSYTYGKCLHKTRYLGEECFNGGQCIQPADGDPYYALSCYNVDVTIGGPEWLGYEQDAWGSDVPITKPVCGPRAYLDYAGPKGRFGASSPCSCFEFISTFRLAGTCATDNCYGHLCQESRPNAWMLGESQELVGVCNMLAYPEDDPPPIAEGR
jgi:hypothetical protein